MFDAYTERLEDEARYYDLTQDELDAREAARLEGAPVEGEEDFEDLTDEMVDEMCNPVDDCRNCGDVGWTIEINDEGVEYIEPCFDCFVAAHEREAA